MGEEFCPVCRGVTTCPGGSYEEVLPVQGEEILFLDRKTPLPEGYVATHWKRRYYYALPRRKGEYELLLTRTRQAERMRAHYGVQGVWVGQCTYAFWVKPRRRGGHQEEENP